jgi:hypothetical protein
MRVTRVLAAPIAQATKHALVRQLRDYLHQVCHSLGLSTRLVPHQLRHTYATQMIRSGVGFPALMTLLGHTSPDMTMRYVDVALTDLRREFDLARSQLGHLVPQPKTQSPHFELASTASSTPCSPLNICWKCSVAPAQRRLPLFARPALQPPCQNPRRSAQTPTTLRVGTD